MECIICIDHLIHTLFLNLQTYLFWTITFHMVGDHPHYSMMKHLVSSEVYTGIQCGLNPAIANLNYSLIQIFKFCDILSTVLSREQDTEHTVLKGGGSTGYEYLGSKYGLIQINLVNYNYLLCTLDLLNISQKKKFCFSSNTIVKKAKFLR